MINHFLKNFVMRTTKKKFPLRFVKYAFLPFLFLYELVDLVIF